MVPAAATAAVVPTERNRLRIGAPIRVVASAYSRRVRPRQQGMPGQICTLLKHWCHVRSDSRSAEDA